MLTIVTTSSPHRQQYSSAMVWALSELKYASLATAITLLLGFVSYLYIPNLSSFLLGETSLNQGYKRTYAYHSGGADLTYRIENNKPPNTSLRLKKDLEILSRRFQRGNFDILSLPGIRRTQVFLKMETYRNLFSYQIIPSDSKAVLQIRSTHLNAVSSLHQYLRYLEKNW